MCTKLETVAINDVLPLKAARRDAVANLKSFWTPGQQRLDFDGFTYIHCVAPPYSAGIVIMVIDSVHGGRVHIPVLLFRRVAQSCRVENGPKISSFYFLAPQFLSEGNTQIFHMYLQIWLTF